LAIYGRPLLKMRGAAAGARHCPAAPLVGVAGRGHHLLPRTAVVVACAPGWLGPT